jgi:beta-galactosidase
VNGRTVFLQGVNWVPVRMTYGSVTREMMAQRIALYADMGLNILRVWGGSVPEKLEFYELCDEMGLMVLDETALFGSSIQLNFEEPAAWERFEAHYDGLVRRDRNHPSVFGWSFGNELFAIFLYNPMPKEEADGTYAKLAALGLRARQLDPTRPFITCDGDEDLRGTLPVWSKHYGHGVPKPPAVDKPMVVGESGGTYYATPGQLAAFNGGRAYESYRGRSEALAIDVYENIVKMARPGLTYFSASETVWFGLEHLGLGWRDASRLPTLRDGVFFASDELPFLDARDWGTLIELLNEDYADLVARRRPAPA